MKKNFTLSALFVFAIILSAAFANNVFAQTGTPPTCASLTAGGLTYTQNFDTLAQSGTSSVVPPGFGFAEQSGTSGNSTNTTYTAGTGSSGTGDTFSFGVAGTNPVTDRAFGTLRSGSLVSTIGGCFVNNTGNTITSFSVTYDGEQYRVGTNTAGRTPDRLDFSYSTDATSLIAGTYIDVDALDFNSPVITGTTGAIDGNAPANRTAGITGAIPSLNIASGATFFIRYSDIDVTGADDGLAIDNFSLTAAIGAPTAAMVNVGGRVTKSNGRGIFRARVRMTDGGGITRYAYTNSLGYYRFSEVEVGQTLIFDIKHKGYNFTEPTQVVSLSDETNTINFTAY